MSGKVTMRPSNKNALLKVVILGDGGVGKSCLMNRFVSNHFDEHSFHTIGVEFLNQDIIVNNETYTLQIWDTAGQERFKTLRTPFYRGSDICLLTYAVNDRTSFQNLSIWRKEFLYYADIKESTSFPFIIVGNKCDISNEEREVSSIELQSWCNENGINSYIETSAKNASNVQQAFELAVNVWLKAEIRADKNDPTYANTVNLTSKKEEGRNSCCFSTTTEEED